MIRPAITVERADTELGWLREDLQTARCARRVRESHVALLWVAVDFWLDARNAAMGAPLNLRKG